jgi:hypothetical protein
MEPRRARWIGGLIGMIVSVSAALAVLAVSSSGQVDGVRVGNVAPDSAEATAYGILQERFGGTDLETYQEATTSLEGFIALEPARNQARVPSETGAPVFAIFVRGSFKVAVPDEDQESGNGVAEFGSARVVVDNSGTVLSVTLWPDEKPATLGFGPDYDAS